jgi:hypothetical protein
MFHNRILHKLVYKTLSQTKTMFSRLTSVLSAKQQPGPVAKAGCTSSGTVFLALSCVICVLALCLGVPILVSAIHASPIHATAWVPGPISHPLASVYALIVIFTAVAAYCSIVMAARKASRPALDSPRKLEQQLQAQATPIEHNQHSAQQRALANRSTTGKSASKYSCSR